MKTKFLTTGELLKFNSYTSYMKNDVQKFTYSEFRTRTNLRNNIVVKVFKLH